MSGYQEKSRRVGGAAACVLALALACVLPAGKAHAENFPEGRGEFDVSVVTEVLPVVDPDAVLCDVTVHVANDAGEHLGDVQVDITVVPPNAEGYDPAGQPQALSARGASHALSASGSTSGEGRVLLPNAAVGATYRVAAVKDGHEGFEGRFTCSGTDGEVWEVTLNRILEPLPTGPSSGAAAVAGQAASETVKAAQFEGGEGFKAAAGTSVRPVRGFMGLAVDAFPYWLIVVGVLVAALVAGFLWKAHVVGKGDAAHEKRS